MLVVLRVVVLRVMAFSSVLGLPGLRRAVGLFAASGGGGLCFFAGSVKAGSAVPDFAGSEVVPAVQPVAARVFEDSESGCFGLGGLGGHGIFLGWVVSFR